MDVVSYILTVFLTILSVFFEPWIDSETAVEKLQPEHQPDVPPPEYTPPSTCSSKNPNPTIHVGRNDICEDCIQQMTWTNHQCRIWLFKPLAIRCGHREYDAARMAGNFMGFGSTMYLINVEGFYQMLGIRGGNAYGIYNLLCSFAPETIGLSDWQLREVYRGAGREQEAAVRR
jgi:hypothetical protein